MLISPPRLGAERRKIASGITLKVAPASLKDQNRAEAEGIMQILEDAGANFWLIHVVSAQAMVQTGWQKMTCAYRLRRGISKAGWVPPAPGLSCLALHGGGLCCSRHNDRST